MIADVRRALRSLAAAKLRAALALLGVVMSTSSFVLLIALVKGGAERLAAAEQSANETDVVIVNKASPPHGSEHRTRRELSRRDATLLGEGRLLASAQVAAEQHHEATLREHGREKRVRVVSALPDALSVYRLGLARGRFLRASDVREHRRVCVIGDEIWRELLDEAPNLSQPLEIDGQVWTVVGVLADKPSFGGSDTTNVWNRKVLVPETAFDDAYNVRREAEQLFIRPGARTDEATRAVMEAVTESTLARLHLGVKNFALLPRADREQAKLIFDIVQVLLVGTALVSLLVGGINIMNVMLVTVTERTREIGICRAVGASPRAIRRQFLIEATTLTLLGGVAGVALGAALAAVSALILRQLVGEWGLHIEPWAMLTGVGLSAAAGLFFGSYPARRAAAVDVIVALRSD